MKSKLDNEVTNDEIQVEHIINDPLLLDNHPEAEVKNSSLRKIVLGVLLGALAGLFVVGVIAAALVFAYGTAGVGPLVLGLFGGIGAVATWSSVAAIGATFVGLCSAIGGFIGNWLFPTFEEIGGENESLPVPENKNGSITILGDLGGNMPKNFNEIQPRVEKKDRSEKDGQTIESISNAFVKKMRERQRKGDFSQARLNDIVKIVGCIKNNKTMSKKKEALRAFSSGSFVYLEAYRQDILTYISDMTKAIEYLETNESNEPEASQPSCTIF